MELFKLSSFLVLENVQKCCLLWILSFQLTFFHLNLYFVKDKCHGNCHMHEETIERLGLVVPVK